MAPRRHSELLPGEATGKQQRRPGRGLREVEGKPGAVSSEPRERGSGEGVTTGSNATDGSVRGG